MKLCQQSAWAVSIIASPATTDDRCTLLVRGEAEVVGSRSLSSVLLSVGIAHDASASA